MNVCDRIILALQDYRRCGISKRANYQNMSVDAKLSKLAFLEGIGDLGKAVTYLVIGGAAAAGAGVGAIVDTATEPTDVDMNNARSAYAIANLKANISRQRQKLQQSIEHKDTIKKTMQVMR